MQPATRVRDARQHTWPGETGFSWKFVNYAPILTFGTILLVTIWWFASARKWFTGPKHTIDEAVIEAFSD